MSVLLTLCVVLLPLATPGQGARRWEPCTGKGCGLGAKRGVAAFQHDSRSLVHPGQGEVGRAEVEKMKGKGSQAITIEMQFFQWEQGGDAVPS